MPRPVGAPFMEDIMSPEARDRPATPALRKESHTKLTPKIRIVHIFAPEVIKTDEAHFRELVQRLTGKPTKRVGGKRRSAAAAAAAAMADAAGAKRPRHGSQDSWCGQGVKGELEEEERRDQLWMEGASSSSFLSGLEEEDSFFQELTNFPSFPVGSSHMEVIGEPHVA